MKERIKKLLTNRVLIYSIVVIACLVNGLAQTFITYDAALGMGDNSTFYAFARNIDNGEVPFKDFIHFRTPGTVTLFAAIMQVLGQQQSTIEIATRLETLVLYPLLFLAAAMVLFRKRSPWYVVAAYAGIALLPGVAQLRAAFGLLAIAVYTLSFESERSTRSRKWILLATGFLASVTFFFGQEIAFMVGLCLVAAELTSWSRTKSWQRIKYLAIGVAVGLLPLLVYMSVFSSIKNFLYYTLYYSFVLQPKFMDLPFPGLGYTTLVYWIPFAMYWLCFLVLYTNKKLGIADALLLSFGILRLITAVGRSDMGHFIFSIPEVFLIVPYLLMRARSADLSPQVLKKFLPYGLVLAALLLLSTKDGIALAPVPFVILLALRKRDDKLFAKTVDYRRNFTVHLALGALLVLFVYIMTPTYLAVARAVKAELRAPASAYAIGGVKTDEITYKEIEAVRAAVKPLAPKTVFAFPIQPFYYSLGDKHASRFLTFEPQTTVQEQDETIVDLQRTKPEVIVFDPLQAQGLSGSLWKISDYITSNYEVKTVVAMREILWVMVPKASTDRNEKLVFSLYHDNTSPDIKKVTVPIESPDQNLTNAIAQLTPSLKFEVEAPRGANLRLSVRNMAAADTKTVCGVVRVQPAAASMKVCSTDGTVNIPIAASKNLVTIQLQTENGQSLIWNDPSLVD